VRSDERQRQRQGEATRGAFGGQIRNCRHIENHNSWRRAEDRAAIPGAYRDRYLDRVTINTDPPGKVAMGIIWGPRGEVTYTYSHAGALRPLLVNPPSSSSPGARCGLSSSSRRRSAIPRESNYFRYARDIGNARARYRLCFTRASGSCGSWPRSSPIKSAESRGRKRTHDAWKLLDSDQSIFIVDPFFRASSLSIF